MSNTNGDQRMLGGSGVMAWAARVERSRLLSAIGAGCQAQPIPDSNELSASSSRQAERQSSRHSMSSTTTTSTRHCQFEIENDLVLGRPYSRVNDDSSAYSSFAQEHILNTNGEGIGKVREW